MIKSTIEKDGETVYINLTQYNTSSSEFKHFNINKIFDEVILNDPSKYEMSIVRCQLYGTDIPIIDMKDYLQTGSLTNTELIVSFRVNNTVFSRPLVWASVSDATDDEKYYYYDYFNFVNIFNNALDLLTTDVNTTFPGTIGSAPRIEYNALQGRFTLFAQTTVFGDSIPLPNRVEIFLNGILYNLVRSLPTNFVDFNNYPLVLRLSIKEVLNPYGASNNIITIAGRNHYGMIQEFPSLECLNSAKSIVIDTDMPVVQEYDDNSKTSQSTSTIQTSRANSFILDGVNGDIFNQVVYLPTAEYRIVNMNSQNALMRIGLKVYWTDSGGNKVPLNIAPKRQASIKLMFRKKM